MNRYLPVLKIQSRLKQWLGIFLILLTLSLNAQNGSANRFVSISGQNLIDTKGQKILIQGTNVGNWLNPEGYMFFFKDTSSYRLIDQAFKEMVGPDFTNWFWREFKNNYITEKDIQYIKSTGMNTVRVPFHYKQFTDEDFMGQTGKQDGFVILDNVIKWSKKHGLYVILDMHVAPGGQTGDNIDDSYGYPWLFTEKASQKQFVDIWVQIAKRYANEPTVMGYDLLNEPIAHYFEKDYAALHPSLEALYKLAVTEIRKVDKNHIVFLGGSQWNSNFSIFNDWKYDSKLAFTGHRYWSGTDDNSIKDFLEFRAKVNLPFFIGETGENTDQWVKDFRETLERNNVGWTFWPYKKMVETAGMVIIPKPKDWDIIVEYTKQDRSSFEKIRNARPDQQRVRNALIELLHNMKFENNRINKGYIEALGMNP